MHMLVQEDSKMLKEKVRNTNIGSKCFGDCKLVLGLKLSKAHIVGKYLCQNGKNSLPSVAIFVYDKKEVY